MKNNKLQDLGYINFFKVLFLIASLILFVCAFREYKGEATKYLLFTIMSYALLYSGFRKNALFFDTFIGIFFWLGFWLKLTVCVAFMDSQFVESSIGNFDGAGASFDDATLIASCGFFGLLMASYVREKLFFTFPARVEKEAHQGLFTFYKKYRKYILIGFITLISTVAITNVYFGIYQRGTVPNTILPYGLSGAYKWLLQFGLASFSAVILKFEYAGEKTTYTVALISLVESFLSNISLLSRGMILNTSALVYGVLAGLKRYQIRSNFRFLTTCFIIFMVLFASSVIAVNYIRTVNFSGTQYSVAELTTKSTQVLFLDRWVGIEGVMAVSSHPDKGWELWNKAWQEKYSNKKISFFDENLIDTPYKNVDSSKHHFISLPGVIAFCFYPGSFIFLFVCMFIIGIVASLLEMLVFRLGGKNVILCALLAQVVAFRFVSFGYVPSQSYLFFGTIVLNIVMIYFADKFLSLWFKRNNKESLSKDI